MIRKWWQTVSVAVILTSPVLSFAAEEGQSRTRKKGQSRPAPQGNVLEKLDTNADGRISEDEAPERMKKAFSKLDGNGDGAIDATELKAARSKREGGPAKKSAESGPAASELFTRFDSDSDGKITEEEAPERMKRHFGRIDANSDGGVDAKEMAAARAKMAGNRPQGAPQRPKGAPLRAKGALEPGALLKQFDKDGDGKLSQEEVPERMKQYFAVIDADSDDSLSGDELAAALRRMRERQEGNSEPGQPGTAAATPKRLFNDQDTDADGRVSKSEAKGMLLDKFSDLDVNDDGQLDVLEVENGLAKKGT